MSGITTVSRISSHGREQVLEMPSLQHNNYQCSISMPQMASEWNLKQPCLSRTLADSITLTMPSRTSRSLRCHTSSTTEWKAPILLSELMMNIDLNEHPVEACTKSHLLRIYTHSHLYTSGNVCTSQAEAGPLCTHRGGSGVKHVLGFVPLHQPSNPRPLSLPPPLLPARQNSSPC